MAARPKRFWYLAGLLALLNSILTLSSQEVLDPTPTVTEKDFVGWWVVQQPEGDTLYIVVKLHGRASSFFSGTGSNRIDKGRWVFENSRLILTWDNGYTDILIKEGRRYFRHEFAPGHSIEGAPNSVMRAQKLEEDRIGSLVVPSPSEGKSPLPPVQPDTPLPPNRSEFIGFWEVRKEKDAPIYYFLRRGGNATRAEPVRRGTDLIQGSWNLVGNEAQLVWDDGSSEVIRKTPTGFIFESFLGGHVLSGTRDSSTAIDRVDVSEVRSYFDLAVGPIAATEDFVGYWKVEDDVLYHIIVDRWSHASRIRFDGEYSVKRLRGRWVKLPDGIHITWTNGNQVTLRVIEDELKMARYPPDVSVTTSAATIEVTVEKISAQAFEDYESSIRLAVVEKRRAEVARQQAEEEERRRAEEETLRLAEERERLRREEEQQARILAEEKEERLRADQEARHLAEEKARRRALEEERLQREELAQQQAEERERSRREREGRRRAEEEERSRRREGQISLDESEERRKQEKARTRARVEARRQAEDEAHRRAEEDVRLHAEAITREKSLQEEQRRADELAREKTQERARQKAEETAHRQVLAQKQRELEAEKRRRVEAQKQLAREAARKERERLAELSYLNGLKSEKDAQLQILEDLERTAIEQASRLTSAEDDLRAAQERHLHALTAIETRKFVPPSRESLLARISTLQIDAGGETGAWKVVDAEGDSFIIQTKPDGTAKSTWGKGPNGFKGQTGTWRKIENIIQITWDDGSKYAVEATDTGYELVAYAGESITQRRGRDVSSATPVKPAEVAVWDVVFEDEFEGESLDDGKWNSEYPWTRLYNNELAGYSTDNVSVRDGRLFITANDYAVSYDGREMDFTGGVVTTHQKFEQAYGYFEIRCRVPEGRGLRPLISLISPNRSPAIDIFEILGHEPDRVFFNSAAAVTESTPSEQIASHKGIDFSRTFHTVGVKWTPEEVSYYIDGRALAQSIERVPREPMYLAASFAVGGDRPGPPSGWTPFPADFEIDYVRVFKRNEVWLERQEDELRERIAELEDLRRDEIERLPEQARIRHDREFEQLKGDEIRRYKSNRTQIEAEIAALRDSHQVSTAGITAARSRIDEIRGTIREEEKRLAQLARIRAEEEAKRRADEEAMRIAEEIARLAAEEEIRRRVEDEGSRIAAEEARREAEEKDRREAQLAQLKVEKDARRQAEEETRRIVQEEARLAAEEETRRRAEEETSRIAAEKARLQEAEQRARRESQLAQLKAEEEARLQAEEDMRHAEEETSRLAAERDRREAEAKARRQAELLAMQQSRDEEERTANVSGLEFSLALEPDSDPFTTVAILNDDFVRSSLNSAFWNFNYPENWVNLGHYNGYSAKSVSLRDGILFIAATDYDTVFRGVKYAYSGGAINTFGKIESEYPSLEILCKAPLGQGLVSSIRLIGRRSGRSFVHASIAGREPDRLHFEVHTGDREKLTSSWKGSDFSLQLQKIGISVSPGTILFTVNGNEVGRILDTLPEEKLYLALSLDVGGEIAGDPTGWTSFPSYFEIDSVELSNR